jgi:phospholipid-transporting ATPase
MVKIRDSEVKRVFYANGSEINKKYLFPSNYLSTTKYNLATFLPFSLFIQFRRVANIYFLVTAILQSIPQISPLHPFSAIAPLVFVLGVSMIREGIEDYLRYRSDKEVNSAPTFIYKNGRFQQVRCQDIQVGHIVMVNKDQSFPCDLIMLSNSNENLVAYIETSTIDGEKNLKTRLALEVTNNDFTPESVIRMFSLVECDVPNAKIYQFNGNLDYMDKKHSLDKNNLLLAGAILRNTAWAVGIATYTGSQTKLRMNLMDRVVKQSKIERIVNRYIVYIIAFQFILCLICAALYGRWAKDEYENAEYLGKRRYGALLEGFMTYFTYFLLLNTMLPISLIISLELLKLAQGFFMQKDVNLYSHVRDRPCKVSSFSLNEELGMVEHIFTDKTGTLTCNKMKFKYCSVGDRVYGESNQLIQSSVTLGPDKEDLWLGDMITDLSSPQHRTLACPLPGLTTQKEILECFVKCMALCHECLIEENEFGINYIGQSPDEITLLDSAMKIGVKYAKCLGGVISLEVTQNSNTFSNLFEKICIFDFDSNRKRNSVVVKDLSCNKYFIFVKGADDIITKLANASSSQYLEKVSKDLLHFSEKGFRTLLLAFKEISTEDFLLFKSNFEVASTSIDSRDEKLRALADSIETGLTILGCTAVEDSLQDEVPQTIKDIRNAGINIWMLTGDKLETAFNIGKTCSLITDRMFVEKCSTNDFSSTLESLRVSYEKIDAARDSQDAGFIIEGAPLEFVLSSQPGLEKYRDEILEVFLKITSACKTVICCRVTPGQKKDVVKIVKEFHKSVTLAIGDGANDVSMILEAQVGIGLYGEEGMQAVQASDYAVGEFRLLWELLFVHGRFNYIRQSETILYFIYKNLVFTLPQFYFAFFCAYSGQTVYDDWYITVYNMVLTALPLMIKGIFEKDLKVPTRAQVTLNSPEVLGKIRSQVPRVYETSRLNKIFTRSAFLTWVFFGVFHSCIIFFIPLFAGSRSVLNGSGRNSDLTYFSVTSFSCIIFVVNLKLALITRLWNIYHAISMVLLSIFLYFGFVFVYDVMTQSIFQQSIFVILESFYFYLCVFVSVSLVLVFDGAFLILQKIVVPKKSEVLLEESIRDDSVERKILNSSSN